MQAMEKTVINTGKLAMNYMDVIIREELDASSDSVGKSKNVKNSTFRNYPESYEITASEKQMIDKMMAEYKGDNSDGDNEWNSL